MLIGFLGIGIILFLKKQSPAISIKSFLAISFTGLIVAAHWIMFFEAIKVSNVSVTLTCLASTSLFVAFIEPLFFRRKLLLHEMIFGLIVIAGLYMIFRFEGRYITGIIYSLISAFLAAIFTVFNGKFIKKHDAKSISFYEMLGGFIGISIYFVATSQISLEMLSMTTSDLIYLLILGLVCTAFAFVISVDVMKELSPFTVCISFNLEPVYAIILALLFFGEKELMTTGFYFGALTILLTIFANAYFKTRKAKKATAVS